MEKAGNGSENESIELYSHDELMIVVFCVFFFRNLVIFVGSLFFMIKLTWKLSTITIVGIPIITMVTHYFGNKIKV